MAALMPQGKQQYFTAGGIPLVGGKVYTYAAGTTTPLATYTTAAASTPNANPVILDSRGEASIFFSAANYKVVVKDSLDSTIWTQDNLPGDQAATIVANLAASTGSSLVGHIAAGTGAVATTVQSKLRESVSVKDFGAVGDGVTDDTAAIAACIAATSNVGVSNGGQVIVFPPGKTYLCHIDLIGTVNNSLGEYGIKLSGYGATLVGRAADMSIISINHCNPALPDPNPDGNIYCNGLRIEGFTLNVDTMPVGAYAIAAHHVYDSSVTDIHVIGTGGLFIGSQCYTWNVENFNGIIIKIQGHDGLNLTTACTFTNTVAEQIILLNCFSMTFLGGSVQGSRTKFYCATNVQALTVIGLDLETTGGASIYYFGPNCRSVVSKGNHVPGVTASTYQTGIAYNSSFEDRPAIQVSGNNIGVYSQVACQGSVFVGTAPTAIYVFRSSSQQTALVLVTGDNGNDGFQDLIMLFASFVTVISSTTAYGSPASRAYASDVGSASLLLNMVSGANHNVRAVVMEYLAAPT